MKHSKGVNAMAKKNAPEGMESKKQKAKEKAAGYAGYTPPSERKGGGKGRKGK